MIKFMKFRWLAIGSSCCLLLFSAYVTFGYHKSFKLGLDFSGGIETTILIENLTEQSVLDLFSKYTIQPTISQARSSSGQEFLILSFTTNDLAILEQHIAQEEYQKLLTKNDLSYTEVGFLEYILLHSSGISKSTSTSIEIISVNHVGPTIGEYLFKSSVRLLLITLILVTIYISFRFRFRFAVGALLALLHDLLITLGLVGLLQIPLSIPIVVALLTILGYSINDTIVIFDRIRENHKKYENLEITSLINRSLTDSISRTLITSITTSLAVFSIYILSDGSLSHMALVLLIGVAVGTYSSIFIASPVLILWNRYISKV